MNPFDYFDEMFCINLDTRPDRWELIQKEFDKFDIRKRVHRFPAIYHEWGAIGCNLSHQAIVKHAKDNNLKNVLIFEDDCQFIQTDSKIIQRAISGLKDLYWELFFIGGRLRTPVKMINENLLKSNLTGCQCFVVNNCVYDRILARNPAEEVQFSKETPWYGCFDRWYCREFESYSVCPLFSIQRRSYSDIGKVLEDKKVDKFYESFKKFCPLNKSLI